MNRSRLSQAILIFFGLLLALLAIGSVSITAHSNHRQRLLVMCGTHAVEQTVSALMARDAATVTTTQVTIVMTDAREKVIDTLAEIARGNTTPAAAHLDQVIADYHNAVDTYRSALQAGIAARNNFPLPDATCLRQALTQQPQE